MFQSKDRKAIEIIENALDLVGSESKNVILSYIQQKYDMDLNALAIYKDEFTNYLREVLGDSADLVISKINTALKNDHCSGNVDQNSPFCYICNRWYSADRMFQHLMHEHTKEEIAYHLSVVYVDDWHEDRDLQEENNATLHQLLHN